MTWYRLQTDYRESDDCLMGLVLDPIPNGNVVCLQFWYYASVGGGRIGPPGYEYYLYLAEGERISFEFMSYALSGGAVWIFLPFFYR